MNAYRIKLGEHYRLGYRVLPDCRNDSCWSRYISSQDHADIIHEQLKEQKEAYPSFEWWIEQFNEDGHTWVRLRPNSMYALFSEDEPEEEKTPVQQDIPF